MNNRAIQQAVEWFMKLDDCQKKEAVRELFEYSIQTEWIGVWSPEAAAEIAEEDGIPIEELKAPYFRTCGEPLVKQIKE